MGFTLFGLASLGLSLTLSVLVYQRMRRLHWAVNLVGAWVTFMACFLLQGWLFTLAGVFARLMPDFPGVGFEPGFNFVVIAACWYWISWQAQRVIDQRTGKKGD
jgi:hypothetical protein